jgi:cobalamin biosynthesis protein CobD/CbiB
MAEKTLVQEKRTFTSQSRGRLIGALLIVAVFVACLVVAAVSPPPGIAFVIWVLVWACSVSIHGAVDLCQAISGSGGSQGFPVRAPRMASSAVVPWAAAESR